MKNNAYWKERFVQLEQGQFYTAMGEYQHIQRFFNQAQKELQDEIELWYARLANNNGVSMSEAKKLLKGKKLEEFKWTVEQYIQYGQDNAMNGQWLKELENASLFHFGYPPLMKKMYEHHGEELQKLMIKVKDTGAATSLDMAAVDSAADVGHIDWKQILEKVIPYVDFFMPSAEELCYMLDKERFADWQKRAGSQDITEILDIEKDIKPLAKQCMDFGAKVLLIKCGTPGIYYRTAGRNTLMKVGKKAELNINRWADKEGFEKSYIPERVLSGTGAGDTSIAAFLTAMLGGYTIEECMQLSTATGASCVTEYDALSGLKSFSELQKKIKEGWVKVPGNV